LTKGQPYSNEKWRTDMDLNMERICFNLFQTWFKLMITTMISTRLQEFDSGVLQPSPLKENLVLRLQAHGGPTKEAHTHHCGERNSGYLEQRNSSVSHVASFLE
jgi:hypothetical protein